MSNFNLGKRDWWSSEKENIKNMLLSGCTYNDLCLKYNKKIDCIIDTVDKLDLIYCKGDNYQRYLDLEKDVPEESLRRKLSRYIFSKYKNTRNYLIQLINNNQKGKIPKGILCKEDFLYIYSLTRRNSNIKYDYDFSKVPEIILGTKQKIIIICNNYRKDGSRIGEYKTSVECFLLREEDPKGLKSVKGTLKFIEDSKLRFGENVFGYDKCDYVGQRIPVILKCPKCNKYFSITPFSHLHSDTKYPSCQECQKERFIQNTINRNKSLLRSPEEIQEIIDNIFGPNVYSFEKSEYKGDLSVVHFTNIITGKVFKKSIKNFLRNGEGIKSMSFGETLIYNWLIYNNINFNLHFKINKVNGRNSKTIFIDFKINLLDNRFFFIEYDGQQHFKCIDFFHETEEEFIKQLKRDINLNNYCSENNINLVRIPYTYNTQEKINEILNKLIILQEEVIIDYPKINKPTAWRESKYAEFYKSI